MALSYVREFQLLTNTYKSAQAPSGFKESVLENVRFDVKVNGIKGGQCQ